MGDFVKRTYLIIIITIMVYIIANVFIGKTEIPVNSEQTLKNVSVVIDPGHGGLDNGASAGGVNEAQLNLEISFALKEELERRGAVVNLTREDEQDLTRRNHHYSKQDDMYLRVKKIDSFKSDYLISIHLNSAPSGTVWGSQVFYYNKSEKGKRLAGEIHESMKEVTGSGKVISGADFRVLRATKTVGVLIECGFISNANERGQLQSGKYHEKLAKQICEGIENYRNKYPEDSEEREEYKELLE